MIGVGRGPHGVFCPWARWVGGLTATAWRLCVCVSVCLSACVSPPRALRRPVSIVAVRGSPGPCDPPLRPTPATHPCDPPLPLLSGPYFINLLTFWTIFHQCAYFLDHISQICLLSGPYFINLRTFWTIFHQFSYFLVHISSILILSGPYFINSLTFWSIFHQFAYFLVHISSILILSGPYFINSLTLWTIFHQFSYFLDNIFINFRTFWIKCLTFWSVLAYFSSPETSIPSYRTIFSREIRFLRSQGLKQGKNLHFAAGTFKFRNFTFRFV